MLSYIYIYIYIPIPLPGIVSPGIASGAASMSPAGKPAIDATAKDDMTAPLARPRFSGGKTPSSRVFYSAC